MRSSLSQAFAYEGGMVWDFVYARRLLSNGTYRGGQGPAHPGRAAALPGAGEDGLPADAAAAAQNLGLGAQTAAQVVEEITQLDMALWADLACVGLNADVKFLLCVRLDLESCHLTLRHLYVGASRATSSELLEAA